MEIHTLTSRWVEAAKPTTNTVLVLHGRGDSMEGFNWLPQEMNISQTNYLFVNAPDDWYGGYSWYDMEPNQLPGITRSRQLLDKVLGELDRGGIPSTDVILFGFSQGCLMGLEWVGRCQKQLRGVVGISGYCYDPATLLNQRSDANKSTPFLITHGVEDEVLPFNRTRDQINILQDGGFNIEFHPFAKGHTIDPIAEIRMLRKWMKTQLGY